ncbi:hypothetical protein POM88_043581 [Heracleum sosnowskyi]|uniref:Transposase n=1 Tax=Heracleum sosnowskyi TaxID=360622 RepID=A0AAD8H1A6_9APIA|nr:hypothetical protein POM88_043581 [Heracleum sosnowskyi]
MRTWWKEVVKLREEARELSPTKHSRSKTLSNEAGSEYRCLENEEDRESNTEEDIVSSKRKKKGKRVGVGTDGPTTRSRASKMSRPSDKQVSAVEESDASEVPIVEKLKLLKNNAPGSMAAYLQLREQEKHAEMEILQSQSQPKNLQSEPNQDLEPKKRKGRGKTKMDRVHTRGEKPEIRLSENDKPISDDDDHLLSEFSNFLGTMIRDFVSLTCRSWTKVPEKDILWQYVKDKYIIEEEGYDYAMAIMRDQFRAHKATIKKDHYTKYPTDEKRLQNRPRNIPLSDFKILLNYWADEKVQERAGKNTEARSKITKTHTAGPRSFAQITHKMAIERMQKAKPDEPPTPISDTDIYVKTRKRDETREYKLPIYVVTKKIEDVQKILEGNVEDANKLVYGGKEHIRSYLEMDEKMEKKVRENVKMMMSKLAEKCPELKVDIEELSVAPPNSVQDGDASGADNDTP